MSLQVVYADNHLLVVEKPACQPMVPDASEDFSLLDEAKAWVKEKYAKPGEVFLGVVHRLDRPVSGVVVFARTSKAASRLSAAWQQHAVEKVYWGWSRRCLPADSANHGTWKQWLWKDRERNRVLVGQRDGAKEAITHWRVLAQGEAGTLLELRPQTGRAHQLRVACAQAGLVLAGDLKYGDKQALAARSIALHARFLRLPHPTLKEAMDFAAAPPSWARKAGFR